MVAGLLADSATVVPLVVFVVAVPSVALMAAVPSVDSGVGLRVAASVAVAEDGKRFVKVRP